MYKLVVTDVDGTLLDSKKEMSEKTKKAIHKIRENGVKFVIATGRAHPAAKWPYIDLGISGLVVSCNGALIKDTATGEVVYKRPLDRVILKSVSDICSKYNKYFHYYTEDTIHSERDEFILKSFREMSKHLPEEKKVNTEILKDYNEFLSRGIPVYKIGIFFDDSDESKKMIDEINAIDGIACYKSLATSFDVMSEGVSKGDAVRFLNEYFGIPKEQTIASGDNENDIDMIKYVGMGVAMDNALDEVKSVADYVTGDNNDEGFLKMLEKFVL